MAVFVVVVVVVFVVDVVEIADMVVVGVVAVVVVAGGLACGSRSAASLPCSTVTFSWYVSALPVARMRL